jgi:hypothetical protein
VLSTGLEVCKCCILFLYRRDEKLARTAWNWHVLPETGTYYLKLARAAWNWHVLPETGTYCQKLAHTAWKLLVLPETCTYCLKLARTAGNWHVLPETAHTAWNWHILPETGMYCLKLAHTAWNFSLYHFMLYPSPATPFLDTEDRAYIWNRLRYQIRLHCHLWIVIAFSCCISFK